jgi:hypothetical protein
MNKAADYQIPGVFNGRYLPSEIRRHQFVMLIKLYLTPISLDENVEDKSGLLVSAHRKGKLVR